MTSSENRDQDPRPQQLVRLGARMVKKLSRSANARATKIDVLN
jgi:hypothetical protein